MDPDIVNLFGVLLSLTVSVAIGGGVFRIIWVFTKRSRPPDERASDYERRLDYLADELDQRDGYIQELEDRVDFLERMLPPLRDDAAMGNARRIKKATTPV